MDGGIDAAQGAALHGARRRLRMTQGQLAAAAGVSERTVRRAERGLPLSDEVARSLCAVLGLDAASVGGADRDAGRPAGPSLPSLRYMRTGELGDRLFARSLWSWAGGAHPLLGIQVVLLAVWADGNHSTKLLLPLIPVATAVGMWLVARKEGCTPRQCLEVLQGKRFLDGCPTRLDERVAILRASDLAPRGTVA